MFGDKKWEENPRCSVLWVERYLAATWSADMFGVLVAADVLVSRKVGILGGMEGGDRDSKVVSTYLWNTPLNLYQQAIKGFLS